MSSRLKLGLSPGQIKDLLVRAARELVLEGKLTPEITHDKIIAIFREKLRSYGFSIGKTRLKEYLQMFAKEINNEVKSVLGRDVTILLLWADKAELSSAYTVRDIEEMLRRYKMEVAMQTRKTQTTSTNSSGSSGESKGVSDVKVATMTTTQQSSTQTTSGIDTSGVITSQLRATTRTEEGRASVEVIEKEVPVEVPVVPKRLELDPRVLLLFAYVKKKFRYKGDLSQFINEAVLRYFEILGIKPAIELEIKIKGEEELK